jgi:hypothetical protein
VTTTTTTEEATTTEAEELERLRLDVDRLTAELEAANLRTAVALEVVPLIDNLVEDLTGRSIVVADIVDCWLRLEPTVHKQYGDTSNVAASAVGNFAADYANEATDAWQSHETLKRAEMFHPEAEQMGRLQWNIHIAQVQQRTILGESPSQEWLKRFPLPEKDE